MNQISYEAGQARRKQQEAALTGGGSKTPVDGVSFTMLLMAPILALMYPIAGSVTVLSFVVTLKIGSFLFAKIGLLKFLLVFGGTLFGFVKALEFEKKISQLKAYRVIRHVLRLILVGGLAFSAIIDVKRYGSFERAMDHASGGALVFAIAVVLLMNWIFPKLDRLWFPANDDRAKKEAKKYEGMSEDDVWHSKNLDWRNKKRFFWIWLGLTVLLSTIFHSGVPVVLIALVSYGICFVLKSKFRIEE